MQPDVLNWPFFEERHRVLAQTLKSWCADNIDNHPEEAKNDDALDIEVKRLLRLMSETEFLSLTAPIPGTDQNIDVRSLCLVREYFAYHYGLADFVFAMQGLGAGPISFFGSDTQRQIWLPKTRNGRVAAAFALSEAASGSDVANITTTAHYEAGNYRLNGEKTWISNGGIAGLYTVFARTGEAPGAKGLSCFIVPAESPGLEIVERLQVSAPHPLARIKLNDVIISEDNLVGQAGQGFAIAMATLDHFRPTVGAAALGFARRALSETLKRVKSRQVFGGTLMDLQMVQGHIADMAVEIDAAALLVYRAAWAKDNGQEKITREAAMAKLQATEAAQRVVDIGLQLHGGDGVRVGGPLEALYREVRALRIYEGASDIQRIVIAKQMAKDMVRNMEQMEGV